MTQFLTFCNIWRTITIGMDQTRIVSNDKTKNWSELLQNDKMLGEFIQTVIDDMDFIGVAERMDESLVLLSFMLDLEVTDVLYTNSKVAGGYMRPNTKQHKPLGCRRYGHPRPLLPAMENFLNSTEFSDLMKIDNALYNAVNKSIDSTIEHVIGRDTFDQRMQEFLLAKEKVNGFCQGKIKTVCDSNGTVVPEQNQSKCYNKGDVGCGYECLNEVFPQ